jgi:glycine cleavage system transcriptional repressor
MTNQPETLHYAVSVVGKDRTGIVAGIAEVLFRLGCNIADSSCTMLAGEFAMILIVSHLRPFSKTRLHDELKPVCDTMGMSLAVRSLHADEVVRQETSDEICMISVYGADPRTGRAGGQHYGPQYQADRDSRRAGLCDDAGGCHPG